MNEYIFCLSINVALSASPDQSPTYLQVAQIGSDPNLGEGDQVHLYWEIGLYDEDKPVNCFASVTKIANQLIPSRGNSQEDVFKKIFFLEILDKEDMPRICDVLQRFNAKKIVLPSLMLHDLDSNS